METVVLVVIGAGALLLLIKKIRDDADGSGCASCGDNCSYCQAPHSSEQQEIPYVTNVLPLRDEK